MARPKIEVKTFKLAGKEFTAKVDGEMVNFYNNDTWICEIQKRNKVTETDLKDVISLVEPLLKMAIGVASRERKVSKDTNTDIKIKDKSEEKPKRKRRTKAEIEADKNKPKKRKRRTKAEMAEFRAKEAAVKRKRKTRSDKGKKRLKKGIE